MPDRQSMSRRVKGESSVFKSKKSVFIESLQKFANYSGTRCAASLDSNRARNEINIEAMLSQKMRANKNFPLVHKRRVRHDTHSVEWGLNAKAIFVDDPTTSQ
jgi:hypothetical protein